jgi:hypothetical protein
MGSNVWQQKQNRFSQNFTHALPDFTVEFPPLGFQHLTDELSRRRSRK